MGEFIEATVRLFDALFKSVAARPLIVAEGAARWRRKPLLPIQSARGASRLTRAIKLLKDEEKRHARESCHRGAGSQQRLIACETRRRHFRQQRPEQQRTFVYFALPRVHYHDDLVKCINGHLGSARRRE